MPQRSAAKPPPAWLSAPATPSPQLAHFCVAQLNLRSPARSMGFLSRGGEEVERPTSAAGAHGRFRGGRPARQQPAATTGRTARMLPPRTFELLRAKAIAGQEARLGVHLVALHKLGVVCARPGSLLLGPREALQLVLGKRQHHCGVVAAGRLLMAQKGGGCTAAVELPPAMCTCAGLVSGVGRGGK